MQVVDSWQVPPLADSAARLQLVGAIVCKLLEHVQDEVLLVRRVLLWPHRSTCQMTPASLWAAARASAVSVVGASVGVSAGVGPSCVL